MRCLVPYLDKHVIELYIDLRNDGWDFAFAEPKVRREAYTLGGHKVWYLNIQATSFNKYYFCALLMADQHKLPVPYGRKVEEYKRICLGKQYKPKSRKKNKEFDDCTSGEGLPPSPKPKKSRKPRKKTAAKATSSKKKAKPAESKSSRSSSSNQSSTQSDAKPKPHEGSGSEEDPASCSNASQRSHQSKVPSSDGAPSRHSVPTPPSPSAASSSSSSSSTTSSEVSEKSKKPKSGASGDPSDEGELKSMPDAPTLASAVDEPPPKKRKKKGHHIACFTLQPSGSPVHTYTMWCHCTPHKELERRSDCNRNVSVLNLSEEEIERRKQYLYRWFT